MPIVKPVYLISLRYGKSNPWVLRGVLYDFTDAEKCARSLADAHKMDDAESGCPEVLLQERHGTGVDAVFVNLAKFHPSVDDSSIVVSFFYTPESTSAGMVVL